MNDVNQHREPRINKQIIFLVCIYIVLSVSNRFSSTPTQSSTTLISLIQSKESIQLKTILAELDKQRYEGEWKQANVSQKNILRNSSGKFQFFMTRHLQNNQQKFTLDFNIKNGEYIDDGKFVFHIPELSISNWEQIPCNQNQLIFQAKINQTSAIKVVYNEELIFRTINKGDFHLTDLSIIFNVTNGTLVKKIKMEIEEQEIELTLKGQKYNMSGTILFALILFLISYSEFSACLQLIKKFIEGEENPINYSFLTFVIAMMWDAGLCLTSFIQAFQNQENIVLFIVPAFVLCLLFTNLELRIIVIVFQAMSGVNDIRQVICRYNLVSYGGIIAMYPLIFITNMGTPLFLFFSLIFLPQIYTNATTGKRPNPNSIYYNEFLLFRFLLILYLRCFPYNIFELKPNYPLGFGCLVIVGCQFGLLWIQKIYGPKKILPKFLLPPVYNYVCNLTNQQQSSQQCTICLQALSKQPQKSSQENEIGYKIMKTPCQHKYHSCCLIQWMKLKTECPQCRAKLPPYQ